jgi:phage gp36-like protein
MSYATAADILEQMDESDLVALTDDTDAGVYDPTAVQRAIDNAGALIDGHCEGRYSLPFNPVPALVRMYAVDLAIYNLYSRRPHVEVPKAIAARQEQAVAYLRRVQIGSASLAGETIATGISQSAFYPGNGRLFSRGTMGDL